MHMLQQVHFLQNKMLSKKVGGLLYHISRPLYLKILMGFYCISYKVLGEKADGL